MARIVPATWTSGTVQLLLPSAEDSTTKLNGGAVVAAAGGITLTIPSGDATPDIGDGVSVLWRAYDVDGTAASIADGQFIRSILAKMTEVGSPDTSSDCAIGIALVDRTDLANANGIRWALHYSSAGRQASCSRIASGTSTTTTSASITIDRLWGSVQQTNDMGTFWYGAGIPYKDDWLTRVAGGPVQAAQGGMTAGDLYWVVTGYRLATTAGPFDLTILPEVLPTNGITL